MRNRASTMSVRLGALTLLLACLVVTSGYSQALDRSIENTIQREISFFEVKTYVIVGLAILIVLLFLANLRERFLSKRISEGAEALKQSEERYRMIIEHSPYCIHEIDREGRFASINEAGLRMLGRTDVCEVVGTSIFDTMLVADAVRIRLLMERAFEGAAAEFEFETRHGRVFHSTFVPMKDKNNAITKLMGITLDVTERRRWETTTKESEERLKLALEGASLGLWDWKASTNVLISDSYTAAILGLSEPSLTTAFDEWSAAIHPEDRDRVLTSFQRHIDCDDSPFETEYRLLTERDESLWVSVRGRALERDASGRALRMVGVIQDVTKRRHAEEAVIRLGRIIEESLNEVYIFDANSLKLVLANRGARENLGYSVESLGVLTWLDIQSEMSQDQLDRLLLPLRKGIHEHVHYASKHRRRDGTEYPVDIHVHLSSYGDTGVFVALILDITERQAAETRRRQLEAQMQYAQKLESLGVLAGGVAHDFNNLLVSMLGYSELALSEMPAESSARDSVHQIEIAARRAADLAKQMLAYSGKGRFVVEPLDLSKLVEEMSHLLEVSILKRATLRYQFPPKLPAVLADATQMRQVVMNLITNASDAVAEKGGAISVATGSMHCDATYLNETYVNDDLLEGPYVYLEVSDNGEGMNAETVPKIFDPFYTTKFTGRGLGLAAVIGIVRGHHGALKVSSERGHGSTFRVLLPAIEQSSIRREQIPKTGNDDAFEGGTILVVDDEASVRDLAKKVLEMLGFSVLTASDGEEAVGTYREHRQDIVLVLLDMTMPKMNGEEAFSELRKIDANVKVMLTSGYDEQDATSHFVGKGLAGFIQKPYQLATLKEKLRDVLGS